MGPPLLLQEPKRGGCRMEEEGGGVKGNTSISRKPVLSHVALDLLCTPEM